MMLGEIIDRIASFERRLRDLEGGVLYGTVTQASPLKVRLDGDTVMLSPSTVRDAVGLAAGARVVCLRRGRELVALGGLGAAAVPFATMRKSTAQAIATGAWVGLSWSSRTDDEAVGMTLDSQGVVVAVPGLYMVTSSINFDGGSSVGNRYSRIDVNGVVRLHGSGGPAPSTSTHMSRCPASGIVRCSAGDLINVTVYQNSGSSLDLGVGDGLNMITCAWIGPSA